MADLPYTFTKADEYFLAFNVDDRQYNKWGRLLFVNSSDECGNSE